MREREIERECVLEIRIRSGINFGMFEHAKFISDGAALRLVVLDQS